ncbi:MAG: exonuclease domain-containing protein [Vicinamibacterales bacterium]
MARRPDFAVVDLETTGFRPNWDRVIEIAVVRLSFDGEVLSEWSTLVNPMRAIAATQVHGITATAVKDAPRFEDIAGDVASQIAGAVFVGHSAKFDASHLRAELMRVRRRIPEPRALCTLKLVKQLGFELPRRTLSACCEELRIPYADSHQALADARATARLLRKCLRVVDRRGLSLRELVPHAPLPGLRSWPRLPASGIVIQRGDAPRRKESPLLDVLKHLPKRSESRSSSRYADFLELVDRVLEDGVVTTKEAQGVLELASEWGLARSTVETLLEDYLATLVKTALRNGTVSTAEMTELKRVASAFGLGRMLPRLLAAGDVKRVESPLGVTVRQAKLTGLSVCFTGGLDATVRGKAVSRTQAERFARKAGLRVKSDVTSELDVLVTSEPHTQSGKAKKARRIGTRIMTEQAFWRAIGVRID